MGCAASHAVDVEEIQTSSRQSSKQSIKKNAVQTGSQTSHLQRTAEDEPSKPITRMSFISHNAACLSTNNNKNLWTTDGKMIYNGHQLYQHLMPYVQSQLDDLEGTPKGMNLEMLKNQITTKELYHKSIFFCRQFKLPDNIMCTAKQHTAVGKLVDDPQKDSMDQQHLESLMTSLENDINKTEALGYFRRVVLRNQPKLGIGIEKSSKKQKRTDPNKSTYQIPNGIEPSLFRNWVEHKAIDCLPNDAKEHRFIIHEDEDICFKNQPAFTKFQIFEQNERNRISGNIKAMYCVDGKYVYNGYRLHNILSELQINSLEKTDYDDWQTAEREFAWQNRFKPYLLYSHCLVLFSVHSPLAGVVPSGVIKLAKYAAVAGKLIPDPDDTHRVRSQLRGVIEDIATGNSESETIKDFCKLAERSMKHDLQEKINNDDHCKRNIDKFMIPCGIDHNDFRKWCLTWIPFETEVDEDYLLKPREDKMLGEWPDADHFFITYWRATWVPFDTDIDGDVAWSVIPLDILKNDDATAEQLSIWEKRSSTNTSDKPKVMKLKRKRIATYYNHKYKMRFGDVDDLVEEWVSKMEKSWNDFCSLCEKWEQGYIDPRPSTKIESPAITRYLQGYDPSRKAHEAMLTKLLSRHKKASPDIREFYVGWVDRMEQSWDQFQEVCKAWKPLN